MSEAELNGLYRGRPPPWCGKGSLSKDLRGLQTDISFILLIMFKFEQVCFADEKQEGKEQGAFNIT